MGLEIKGCSGSLLSPWPVLAVGCLSSLRPLDGTSFLNSLPTFPLVNLDLFRSKMHQRRILSTLKEGVWSPVPFMVTEDPCKDHKDS